MHAHNTHKRRWLLAGGTAVSLALLLWLTWPTWLARLVTAVPAPYRHHLPAPLIAVGAAHTPPLPTALPAPPRPPGPTSSPPTIILPTLPPTFTPRPTPAPSLPPALTPSPRPTLSPSPRPTATLPPTIRLTGLDIIPQKFNNCGPASLTQVLNFYGLEVTQQEVAAVIRPSYDDRNVSPAEIVAYVNTHTELHAETYVGGDLPLLKRLVAAGYPVIIEKGLVLESHDDWMGHYLTVFGYDDAAQMLWTLDTFLGPFDSVGRQESYDTVSRYWRHFNYRFILVYPPEQGTAVSHLLAPLFADPLTMWQTAASAAQTAVTDSPADPFAWFNLGSSLTTLGQLTGERIYHEQAALSFDEARRIGLPWRMLWYQFEPYIAYLGIGRIQDVLDLTDALLTTEGGRAVEETYLYRGHALRASGDADAATLAFKRARDLNPNIVIVIGGHD